MDLVVEEAQQLAVQVVNRVLSDETTIEEAKRVLRDALQDQELRNSAKESLWNIVLPWSQRSTDEAKRALRAAEDLAASPFLTEEERSFLRSLQARLKNEGSKRPSPETKKSSGREEPASAATSPSQEGSTGSTPAPAMTSPQEGLSPAPESESPQETVDAAPSATPVPPEVSPPLKALKGPAEQKLLEAAEE
eukprot:symbB.v1.2.020317.t1/scaffold1699.1/size108456/2